MGPLGAVRPRLARLPLRFRLVAGFSVAMLVVLVGAAAFVYWRVQYALDRGLDADLSTATLTLTPLVDARGRITHPSAAAATGVAWQVLTTQGQVLAHGGSAGDAAMVGTNRLPVSGTAGADGADGAGGAIVDVGDLLPISTDPYRLELTRLPAGSAGIGGTTGAHYLLVGVRRDHRDEALRELLGQLAIAGFGALVVTGVVGERLARAALRPVERYRRQAAAIADGDPDLRLDVPIDRDDEVTRLGHTFNVMLAGLERSLDRERQFVREASHELRTPITLLGSRIQLARRRPRSVADHEQILEELEVDLTRLARLAEQLLELGGAQTASTSAGCDLVEVARTVLRRRRVADPTGGGSIRLVGAGVDADEDGDAVPAHLPVALTDVEAERILTNLLDNAIRHGAAPWEIGVDRAAPAWARLWVADGGPGMTPELLTTATQRFTRAEEARARPGAGLGLALVEALVLRAGGALRLCHDGRHVTLGADVAVACHHDGRMTVAVLLPMTG